ncbi:MAG: trigger factor [Brachymonas sp.]|jgi:trigger factor|nr:trigger factor [Brachymonas sp.]
MSVNVETLEKLERKLVLTVPTENINFEINKRLQKLARNVKMDGFRPGKVPMNVVTKQYHASVQQEVMNEKVGRAFYDAVTEAGLNVAGQPTINQLPVTSATEMQFEALFEVFPEVQIGEIAQAEVEKIDAEVDDSAVERTLDILRKQRRTFAQRPADQAAADGDRVTVDFEGKIDGEVFEGGKAEDFQYMVGEGQMLKEFEDAVRGMKVGESKTFPLTFPEEYHGKEVAGKTADFLVTLKKVEAGQLPEVDGTLAKQLGVQDGSVETLRADIRKNLNREVKARLKSRNKNAVMDALIKVADLELPKVTVEAEISSMMDNARADMQKRGVKDVSNVQLPPDLFRNLAERRVRLALIVSSLVQQNKLQATPEQVKAHIEDLAASYEKPEEVVRWYQADPRRLSEIEAIVTEDNVTSFVLEKAKVTEKKVGFDELMARQA